MAWINQSNIYIFLYLSKSNIFHLLQPNNKNNYIIQLFFPSNHFILLRFEWRFRHFHTIFWFKVNKLPDMRACKLFEILLQKILLGLGYHWIFIFSERMLGFGNVRRNVYQRFWKRWNEHRTELLEFNWMKKRFHLA